ncbi:hypothetical protein ACFQY0_08485 [Haloferula chungangensis]|uniref:Uncharacterized protein n=1 Tax=Haloferula chungangensis TaxID=1048331 RepID=A0ABW2L4C7_9BACT
MNLDEDSSADSFFSDLIAAVEQQLNSPATPYVKQTYERLIKAGVSEDEAKEMIAECLAEESDAMFRGKREFDEKSYRLLLGSINPEG